MYPERVRLFEPIFSLHYFTDQTDDQSLEDTYRWYKTSHLIAFTATTLSLFSSGKSDLICSHKRHISAYDTCIRSVRNRHCARLKNRRWSSVLLPRHLHLLRSRQVRFLQGHSYSTSIPSLLPLSIVMYRTSFRQGVFPDHMGGCFLIFGIIRSSLYNSVCPNSITLFL